MNGIQAEYHIWRIISQICIYSDRSQESHLAKSKGEANKDNKDKTSEADIIVMLKKRLSKNTRRLIIRSCTDSKFFKEFEELVIAFKFGNETEKPTTFEEPEREEVEDLEHRNPHFKESKKRRKLTFKEFDSFQRFLAHRIAKFHDVQSESIATMGCRGMKVLELSLPNSAEAEQHHKYRILEVLTH